MRSIAAAALALLALLLAAITLSAISSGVDGLLVIVVGAAGCGAVLLGLIAAWLWSSSGSDYQRVLPSVRSRRGTDLKFRAPSGTQAAERKPAPLPASAPLIQPEAQLAGPASGPHSAAPTPTPQNLPAAPNSRSIPRLRARDVPVCDYTPPKRAARTPGQRRIFLGVGLLFLFSGVHDIRTGEADISPKGKATKRAEHPLSFWSIVALQLGFAGALLSVAAREAMAARRQRRDSG